MTKTTAKVFFFFLLYHCSISAIDVAARFVNIRGLSGNNDGNSLIVEIYKNFERNIVFTYFSLFEKWTSLIERGVIFGLRCQTNLEGLDVIWFSATFIKTHGSDQKLVSSSRSEAKTTQCLISLSVNPSCLLDVRLTLIYRYPEFPFLYWSIGSGSQIHEYVAPEKRLIPGFNYL
jgi:hypothetical protein